MLAILGAGRGIAPRSERGVGAALRRSEGSSGLTERQYARYPEAALDVFQAAADHEPGPPSIDMTDLTNFLVAAMDGLVIRYGFSHDAPRCLGGADNVLRASTLLVGVEPLKPAEVKGLQVLTVTWDHQTACVV